MVEEKGPALDGQRAGTGATRLVTKFFFIRNALSLMNPPQTNRSWNLMSWNVRGLNSKEKWSEIRDKIIEANCDIICLQETKKRILIWRSLGIFAQQILINLNFCPLLGPQEESSLFGKADFSMESSFSVISLPSQLKSLRV